LLRVPEWAGLKADYLVTASGETLQENTSGGAHANYGKVNYVIVGEMSLRRLDPL
jgi:hypothetical protein